MICPRCHGDGEIKSRTSLFVGGLTYPCTLCHGDGTIDDDEEDDDEEEEE